MDDNKTLSPAEMIRQEQRALAVRRVEHDGPQLDRADELLESMKDAAKELEQISGNLLVSYVGIHFTALSADWDRAKAAVKAAKDAQVELLSEN